MFKNLWRWILEKVGAIAKMLEKPAEIANKIVNVIKEYVENPVVDLFTALTRSGIDNKIVDLMRTYLPGVLSGMLKAENIIKDLTKGDIGSLLRCFVDYINSIAPDARGKWWAELAALLLPLIAGKPGLSKPVSMAVTQTTYLKNAA